MQSYRRAVDPMVLRRFSRRPQKIGKRYTGSVRTAPSVQTKVNPPHDRAPWGNGQSLATAVSSSHALLPIDTV